MFIYEAAFQCYVPRGNISTIQQSYSYKFYIYLRSTMINRRLYIIYITMMTLRVCSIVELTFKYL